MDAVQELSRREWHQPVREFVVSGASKRGWTTWLAAVHDARVRAIAPMVFDNLNFARQMTRQRRLWARCGSARRRSLPAQWATMGQ